MSNRDPELRKLYDGLVNLKNKYSYKRKVICSAHRLGDDVICSPRHFDYAFHAQVDSRNDCDEWRQNTGRIEQGFIDQWGIFMGREEALEVAQKQNQIIKKHTPYDILMSEDLY